MKKLFFFGIILLFMVSCHNYKKDAERLSVVRDSLQQEGAIKDSSIVSFLGDFNEIQANLDSIKKLENLVTVESRSNNELKSSQKTK